MDGMGKQNGRRRKKCGKWENGGDVRKEEGDVVVELPSRFVAAHCPAADWAAVDPVGCSATILAKPADGLTTTAFSLLAISLPSPFSPIIFLHSCERRRGGHPNVKKEEIF
jgi:hypothetical protein